MQPVRAEPADVRRGNLALVLRRLREAGPRSRAKLAEETDLTKATVSSLVADLLRRGLLAEGTLIQPAAGRPALNYQLGTRVYGIGVEISVDYLSVVVLDLTGAVRVSRRRACDVPAATPAQTLDAVASLVRNAAGELTGGWAAGLAVAAPGHVDELSGRVSYAAALGWHDVPVVAELARRLPELAGRIELENDVRFSAIAEYAMGAAAGTADLAYLSGETGVGVAVVIEGRLARGAYGYAGEIGHLPLNSEPVPCPCGRTGCWETLVGLAALLRYAADPGDPVHDHGVDVEVRLAELARRADAGDRRTRDALHRVARGLGLGASVLLNLVNPGVLVLGGYFAVLGEHLLAEVREEIAARVIAPDSGGCRVELSRLTLTAAALGGAYTSLERVFADPTVVPPTPVPTAAC
ncbi:MAG: ROK family transcriptional regulator [Micromonosporaceae bacterium]